MNDPSNDYKGKDIVLRGLLFAFAVAYVDFIACAFLFPLCFAFIIGPARPLFRVTSSIMQNLVLTIGCVIVEFIGGTRVRVSSNQKLADSVSCFIISNHRTRLDWMYIWSLCFRFNIISTLKIVAKADMRNMPLIGWTMQMFGFFFLQRDWAKDEEYLSEAIDSYTQSDSSISPLLFPEGTDLHPKARDASNDYARKNKLPEFKYVIHPKSKGMNYLLNGLRSCNPVLMDVTIGYIDSKPGERPNEKALLAGRFPKEVLFFVKYYEVKDIPTKEADLKVWLLERWVEKEALLKNLYENNEVFPGTFELKLSPLRKGLLLTAGFTGAMICLMCTWMMMMDTWYVWWVLGWVLFFSVATKLGGIDVFNIKLHKLIQAKLPPHMRHAHKSYSSASASVASSQKPKAE